MMEILGEKEYLKCVKRFSFEQDCIMFIQGLGPLALLFLGKLTPSKLSLLLGKEIRDFDLSCTKC